MHRWPSRAAEKHMNSVILSEAEDPGSSNFNELQGSFVALGSSG